MRVLIDTDPGLGLRFADVDDALALFLMLNNNQFEIEGITTVFGNTPVNKGYPLLKKYLKLANKTDIPNKMGASRKEELGILNDASKLLIEKVKENPKELTLLTLGPFTNVATALIHYPEFFDDLKKIVIMGGTLSPITLFNPFYKRIDRRFFDKIKTQQLVAEFNSLKDPRATKKVLEASTFTPRIQMGLEVCCRTVIRDEHIKQIESVNKPIPQFISKHVKFWLKIWKVLSGRGGFFPFDTCVPIYLLEPELFKTVSLFLNVDEKKIPGKLSISKGKRENSSPITYCTNFVDKKAKERFMDILISNLTK